jgi:rRNA maturation endonuclease Nob1
MFYPSLVNYPISISAAESAGREARTGVELVKHDIDRLLLITEALWTLLKQEHGYADEVLTKMMAQIDQRDGQRDGHGAKEPPLACTACGRSNAAKRTFCMYCGEPLAAKPFAR